MAQKASIAEYEIRVDTVAEMLVKGCKRPEILRYSASTWDISVRQTDEYIANARSRIDEVNAESLKEQVSIALARYNDLIKKNYQIQDYRECRAVQDSINKLLGLEAAIKIQNEHTGPNGGPIQNNNTHTVVFKNYKEKDA